MKYSIVVPCYNEAKNIPLILNQFSKAIEDVNLELILVNNGSTDETENTLKELIGQYPFARAVKVEKNQGYGYGILFGLKDSSGDYLGWTHADMQTDPKDVIRAIKVIQEAPDKNIYIKGNRKKRPLSERFLTIGMQCFESLLFGQRLYEINAQPNIFPRVFYQKLKNPPLDFSLDLYFYVMAKKLKYNIKRIDVEFPPRIHGESSWATSLEGKYKNIKKTILFSLNLRKNQEWK